jgi:4-amino-4-deoxy-L-arabinose transferase-like glycosyltransferase
MAVLALCLIYIAGDAVWLLLDSRVPDFDSGKHLLRALDYRDQLASFDLLGPLQGDGVYQPFVHIVGAVAMLAFGEEVGAGVFAQDLLFIPALAFGSYLVGSTMSGSPFAGVLAALFSLGTPMVISTFHVFLLDPPQTALVALSVGALLKSDRLRETPWALVAGAAAAGGLMTKATTAIFLLGPVLVVLARGGWRRPRGLAALAAPVLVFAVPWYLAHLGTTSALTAGAAPSGGGAEGSSEAAGSPRPPAWTSKDFGWYVWNALNLQLFVPLLAFFAAGLGWCAWRLAHRREPGRAGLEVLAGLLVSYAGVTALSLHDFRYSLPMLVFVAALATTWIGHLPAAARRIAAAALVVVCAVNIVGINVGAGSRVRFAILPGAPGESALGERQVTIYNPNGFPYGKPRDDGILDRLRQARRDGVKRFDVDPASANVFFLNPPGLEALARMAGIARPGVYDPGSFGPRDLFLVQRAASPTDPPPCFRLEDGSSVYASLGSPLVPFEQFKLYCPGRDRPPPSLREPASSRP